MRRSFRVVCFAVLAGLASCTAKTSNGPVDSQRAKYILVTALDAWKAGRAESLSTRTPPIRFADDDQKAGLDLIDYQFDDEAAQIKPFQKVKMFLSLKDKQGQTSRRAAAYQVGVERGLTVLRSDN